MILVKDRTFSTLETIGWAEGVRYRSMKNIAVLKCINLHTKIIYKKNVQRFTSIFKMYNPQGHIRKETMNSCKDANTLQIIGKFLI